MFKRFLVIVLPLSVVLITTALFMQSHHPAAKVPAVPEAGKVAPQKTTGMNGRHADHPSADIPLVGRILDMAKGMTSPAEMAALLKQAYAENPDGLFDALMAMGKESWKTRRRVLPLVAAALTWWPEAEGRYVFPIAEAYAEIDLPAAAEWGAAFLIKTGRSDLAASSLLGLFSETSEVRALSLIATLPEEARRDAMHSVAYHMPIGDLDHLMQVCRNLDPQGTSAFSKQLFERLGMERPDETAAWLLITPGAERIPGAVSSISRALVLKHGPQKAMAWADSLPEVEAEAQAITAVYREWAKESPENAIKDILAVYEGAPQLMADVFKGAAEHHGSGAVAQWAAACSLVNASARAYAVSALVEPMLITSGPAETQVRIAALPPDSLERNAAELMVQAAYKNPATVKQMEIRFGKIE